MAVKWLYKSAAGRGYVDEYSGEQALDSLINVQERLREFQIYIEGLYSLSSDSELVDEVAELSSDLGDALSSLSRTINIG